MDNVKKAIAELQLLKANAHSKTAHQLTNYIAAAQELLEKVQEEEKDKKRKRKIEDIIGRLGGESMNLGNGPDHVPNAVGVRNVADRFIEELNAL